MQCYREKQSTKTLDQQAWIHLLSIVNCTRKTSQSKMICALFCFKPYNEYINYDFYTASDERDIKRRFVWWRNPSGTLSSKSVTYANIILLSSVQLAEPPCLKTWLSSLTTRLCSCIKKRTNERERERESERERGRE